MTPNERRIKVAELKGWTNCYEGKAEAYGTPTEAEAKHHWPRDNKHVWPLPDYEGDANLWAAMYRDLIEDGYIVETERQDKKRYSINCVHPTHDRFLQGVYESLAIAVIEAWIAWKESA